MDDANNAIDADIKEARRLRQILKCGTSKQVTSHEERSVIKATSFAWFNNHRKFILEVLGNDLLKDIDGFYKCLISKSDLASIRSKYDEILKNIIKEFPKIREYIISASTVIVDNKINDKPLDFSPLIPDPAMRKILTARWVECMGCIEADLPLAATVMMGGLIEAVLLARINREPDKSAVYKANRAPKFRSTNKTIPLNEWTLRNFIDVTHELGWISQSAKDVAEVLRDYRNYIHPYKQLSHNVEIKKDDIIMFWGITKSICSQIVTNS
jgi:hypothetical protein